VFTGLAAAARSVAIRLVLCGPRVIAIAVAVTVAEISPTEANATVIEAAVPTAETRRARVRHAAAGPDAADCSEMRAAKRTAVESAGAAEASAEMAHATSAEMPYATSAEMASAETTSHMATAASTSVSAATTTAAASQHRCRERGAAEGDRGDCRQDNVPYH